MSLPMILANGDVGCEVAAYLNLNDLCRMHASSQALKRETKVLVARSDAAQRKVVCDLTPFVTKKALTDFLAKGPTWLNDFIPPVRVKLQRFDTDAETRLRDLHARIAYLNKTARKEKEKLRRAPHELEDKIAKLRRTEAEKLDQLADSLKQTKGNLAASVCELASVCSLARLGGERDPICV
jgi:predicted metal-dependent hydrolase